MNFDDTPQEAAFRAEVRAWIAASAPRELEPKLRLAGFASTGLPEDQAIIAAKAWQKKKAAAGYACLTWSKDYGGGGRTPIEQVIWSQEEGPYGVLSG
ncbi:MAG: acyl-CoA dehydrogenase family protein, partial [Caulobacteraceae bacterium]|nr:acyl-CoA dehydrogenase family protein [Caulobacteraceae bacterium]